MSEIFFYLYAHKKIVSIIYVSTFLSKTVLITHRLQYQYKVSFCREDTAQK